MKLLTYQGFKVEYPSCTFFYEYDSRSYTKTISLCDIPLPALSKARERTVHHILAHTGMSLIPHLFVVEDFDRVCVEPLWLSPSGILFYQSFFLKGLAELRLRNRLRINKEVEITVYANAPRYEAAEIEPPYRALLLNGGGKDSCVAAELLKQVGLPFTWLSVGLTPAMSRIMAASKVKDAIQLGFESGLSKKTIKYEGHRPFSSLLAYMSLLPAYILGYRYVVVANEYSSNFGNLSLEGVEINHQYSKSYEFERMFADFVNQEILRGVSYFSILRPLYEIQIARMFAQFEGYFHSFISCNLGHKQDYWCNECPKCAFIFLILSAFLPHERVVAIFGRNLFETSSARKMIRRLTGAGVKPFECVGTVEEAQLSLYLALQKEPPGRLPTEIREELKAFCQNMATGLPLYEYLHSFERPHSIPPELAPGAHRFFERHLAAAPCDPATALCANP